MRALGGMLSWRGTPATQDYCLRIEEPQSTQRTQSEERKEISLFFSATSAFSAVTCIRASKLAGGIFPDPKSAWPAEVAKCLHCGPWPGPKRRAGPPRKHAARKLRMLSPWSSGFSLVANPRRKHGTRHDGFTALRIDKRKRVSGGPRLPARRADWEAPRSRAGPSRGSRRRAAKCRDRPVPCTAPPNAGPFRSYRG